MSSLFTMLALLSACVMGGLWTYGNIHDYFWLVPGYDIPIHLLGGLTAGLWASAVAWRLRLNTRRALLFIVAAALAGGIVWEMFEYGSGLTRGEPHYWFDTSKDLLNDTLGGLAGWLVYAWARKYKTA